MILVSASHSTHLQVRDETAFRRVGSVPVGHVADERVAHDACLEGNARRWYVHQTLLLNVALTMVRFDRERKAKNVVALRIIR